jgi:hypothetical protein
MESTTSDLQFQLSAAKKALNDNLAEIENTKKRLAIIEAANSATLDGDRQFIVFGEMYSSTKRMYYFITTSTREVPRKFACV